VHHSGERELASRIFEWAIEGEVLDDRLVAWQAQGSIGFAWLLEGWGAALAAATAALEIPDWCFPGPREARIALWRGLAPAAYLAQLQNCNDDQKRAILRGNMERFLGIS